jgi:enoyl-CoA hydratase/carnithine racemase
MSQMDSPVGPSVLTERRGSVLVVTLNRPSVRNAVNRELAVGLASALQPKRGYELGLVNRLTDPGQALSHAVALAATIAGNGPLALLATKKIVEQESDWSEEEFWPRQEQIPAPAMRSEDAREGAVAFAEKRAPVWRGR